MENNELGVLGVMSAWIGFTFSDATAALNTFATTIATVGGAVLVCINVYKSIKNINKDEETQKNDD